MPIDYAALRAELQNDPKHLGYATPLAAGADQTCADLLNQVGASGETVARASVPSKDAIAYLVRADVQALTQNDMLLLVAYAASGTIDLVDPVNGGASVALQNLEAMFPATTQSGQVLRAMANRGCSRAEALFGAGTAIGAWDVAHAMGRTG